MLDAVHAPRPRRCGFGRPRHPVVGADHRRGSRPRWTRRVEGHPEASAATSGTAPAHRVGDLRDRPPAPGPAPMVDPPVWWRISRAHSIPGAPGVVIQSSPARPVLLRPMAPPAVALSEPARTPGGTTGLEEAHLASRWSWVVVPPKGACRGPMSSAPPTPWPRVLGRLGPQAAPPEPPRGRAGSSPRAPVITGLSGVDPPGTGRTPAPDSLNRRATSHPSTGPFPSSAALNQCQSFHQGSHKPLNTPGADPARAPRLLPCAGRCSRRISGTGAHTPPP